MKRSFTGLVLLAAVSTGCSDSNSPKTDADYQQSIVTGMHDSLLEQIKALHAAAVALANAAPAPTDRGWDATLDAAAIQSMEKAWTDTRTAYEEIEGATAPLFPDVDNE